MFVRHGTVVGIPGGYHPVCAAPGTHLYYLWALAGAERGSRCTRTPCTAGCTTPDRSLVPGTRRRGGNCDQRRDVTPRKFCERIDARWFARRRVAVQSCAIEIPGCSVALPAVRDTVAVADLA